MIRLLFLVLAFLALQVIGPASAQSDGAWQTMTFHDLREPSSTDPLQTLVWPDVIREVNDYTEREFKRPLHGKNGWIKALSKTFQQSEITYIVSTALYRACDSGANNSGSGVERSICPLRIVRLEQGRAAAIHTGTGCYIDPPDRAMPASNQHDGIQVRFDPVTGVLGMRAIIGGTLVADCSRSIPLR